MNRSYAFRSTQNKIMLALCALCTAVCILVLFYMVVYVFIQGISFVNTDFFTKNPVPLGKTGGGARNSLIGSGITVGLAAVIGLPIGILCGILVNEYANPRIGGIVRFTADVLSGIPSIVIGIFIYELVVVRQGHFSALSGSVALAVIMLPIVARSAEEMLKLVPISQREAALALGLPKWRTIINIVLPAAKGGLMTASLLAVARAAGETAPLFFTVLGNRFETTNINEPMNTLPLLIYRYAISPYKEWHEQAWAAAFFLIMIVLIINIVARMLTGRLRGGTAR